MSIGELSALMTTQNKFTPQIIGIMSATTLATFGTLVGSYYLLF